ncbi:MAG: hypothetical protein EOO90_07400 [Pedobacter sp.]|nr:MAG: hypothetical protein EOO90_07400 [Pedobacter sp.]
MKKFLSVSLIATLLIGAIVAVANWQGLSSPVFAWTLNFMLMTGVLSFTQIYKPALTSHYYNSKKWERDGKVYRWLGVNGFRKLLVWIGWEKLNKAANPVKNNLDAIKHLEYGTRQSEFGHLLIFFIVLTFTVFVGIREGLAQTAWLIALNIVLNIYPILVQRFNRPRLRKVLQRCTPHSST